MNGDIACDRGEPGEQAVVQYNVNNGGNNEVRL